MIGKAGSSNHQVYDGKNALDKVFDLPEFNGTISKYMILSVPRSGSTLLSSALHNTRLAGVPHEYFHESVLKKVRNPELDQRRFNLYINNLYKTRTSRNGVFGIKCHYVQFEKLFISNPNLVNLTTNFINQYQKFILIYRRDKVLQAISAILSKELGIWSTNDERYENKFGRVYDESDAIIISEYIKRFYSMELSWRKICKKYGLLFIEVAYEDLSENFEKEFNRILDFLQINDVNTLSLERSTIKTSNMELTLKIKHSYLKAIGAIENHKNLTSPQFEPDASAF